MPIYIVVGDPYGPTCVYWVTEQAAVDYKRHLEEISPNFKWRIVTFFPPLGGVR